MRSIHFMNFINGLSGLKNLCIRIISSFASSFVFMYKFVNISKYKTQIKLGVPLSLYENKYKRTPNNQSNRSDYWYFFSPNLQVLLDLPTQEVQVLRQLAER